MDTQAMLVLPYINERPSLLRLLRTFRVLSLALQARGIYVFTVLPFPKVENLSRSITKVQTQRQLVDELIVESGLGVNETKNIVKVCRWDDAANEINSAIVGMSIDMLLVEASWMKELGCAFRVGWSLCNVVTVELDLDLERVKKVGFVNRCALSEWVVKMGEALASRFHVEIVYELDEVKGMQEKNIGVFLEEPFDDYRVNYEIKRSHGVIVVQTGLPSDFRVSRLKWYQEQQSRKQQDSVKWFAENTFDSTEFEDIGKLVALKNAQGLTISLGLPALNEEATIGQLISSIKNELVLKYPLLDEIVLIDSRSSDRTVEIARQHGIPVYVHQEILPSVGERKGKGEALWKSLHVLKGDIICWIDTDTMNSGSRLVYGLVGALLREPRLKFVKGFYQRPITIGDALHPTGGGRVTELTIKPLFNLFFPELSSVIHPLAGECAGRRSCLERLPFFTGYGVETGHLLDLLHCYGLSVLGQVNLHERTQVHQELSALGRMSFALIQVVIKRLRELGKIILVDDINKVMKTMDYNKSALGISELYIEDQERPPIVEIPEYIQKHYGHAAKL